MDAQGLQLLAQHRTATGTEGIHTPVAICLFPAAPTREPLLSFPAGPPISLPSSKSLKRGCEKTACRVHAPTCSGQTPLERKWAHCDG